MPHFSEKLAGSGGASQYQLQAQASTIQAVPSNGRRLSVSIYNGGQPVFLGYGATASATAHMPLASGMLLFEPDYKGQIQAIVGSTTATSPLFITDVMAGPIA